MIKLLKISVAVESEKILQTILKQYVFGLLIFVVMIMLWVFETHQEKIQE